MGLLSFGTYLRTLCKFRSQSKAATQVSIGRALIAFWDESFNQDDSAISNYARGARNLPSYISKSALQFRKSSYPDLVRYFEENVIPLLNPSKLNQIVRVLMVIISEDADIENDVVVDEISNSKKRSLRGISDKPDSFLAGIFLYILRFTENKTPHGFVNKTVDYYSELAGDYEFKNWEEKSAEEPHEDLSGESAEYYRKREIVLVEERIEQEATSFCIDHDAEKDLIPLCQVIAVTDPIRNHVRKMYNDFCKCSLSVQNKILEKNEITPISVIAEGWWYGCIDLFLKDYRKYNLGAKNHEYLFHQYFTKGLYSYREEPIEEAIKHRFPPNVPVLYTSFGNYGLDIEGLLDEYMYYQDYEEYDGKIPQPMEYIYEKLDFSRCDDSHLIMYLCQFIRGACLGVLCKRNRRKLDSGISCPEDAYDVPNLYELDTLEDLFFSTLISLYRTYMVGEK